MPPHSFWGCTCAQLLTAFGGALVRSSPQLLGVHLCAAPHSFWGCTRAQLLVLHPQLPQHHLQPRLTCSTSVRSSSSSTTSLPSTLDGEVSSFRPPPQAFLRPAAHMEGVRHCVQPLFCSFAALLLP